MALRPGATKAPPQKAEEQKPAQQPELPAQAAQQTPMPTPTALEPSQENQQLIETGEMPSYLVEASAQDAGKGVSTDQADNIVPLIYVMQPLSPQVDQSSPQYMEGAKPGSIWLRNAPDPMVDEMIVQACRFWKDWVQWVPRTSGGGFVGRHENRTATEEDVKRLGDRLVVGEDMPDLKDATFTIDPNNRQKVWKIGQNDLILTRNHALRVFVNETDAIPYVLPLKGTGNGVSKEWMGKMNQKRTASGALLPAWACLYKITTRPRQNPRGRWFQMQIEEAGPDGKVLYVSKKDYELGKAIYDAFESGEKVAAAEDSVDHSVVEGGDQPSRDLDDEIPF